ncbi:MAG: glycosyltransferase family 4 protein [Rhodospirillaceae bacterium]
MTRTTGNRRRLLFAVTEDWAFLRHRLPMARAAMAAGFDVAVAAQTSRHATDIEARGIRVFHVPVRRAAIAPFADMVYFARLAAVMQEYRPDIVHNVATKPILYGTVAARAARVPAVINAFTGMGILFHEVPGERAGFGIKGNILLAAIRSACRRAGIGFLVQNEDDRAFVAGRLAAEPGRVHLISGSGVDTDAFPAQPEPADGPVTATLVGRLLWSKGVGEFVEAARRLKQQRVNVRMVLVGSPDPENPTSVRETDLRRWQAEGLIEWWGERDDIAAVWAKSHIAVLPSRREGLPKSMLEAASSGRPLIMTDVPGCRELAAGDAGAVLCPLGDVDALTAAIARLAGDPDERRRMGAAARCAVEARMSAQVIGEQVKALYQRAAWGAVG